jgi:hypothetical protein
MLRPKICHHLLGHLLDSENYKKLAVDLIIRMKSFGYHLPQYQIRKQIKNVLRKD